jgi:hypothetical protein
MNPKSRALLAAGVLSVLYQNIAAQNLVSNGGFELPGFISPPGYRFLSNGDSTSIQGWVAIDDGVGEQPYLMSRGSYTVYEGNYSLTLNQGSGIRTTVSLQAGQQYQLSFLFPVATGNASPLRVDVGGFTTTFTPLATPQTFAFTASSTNPLASLQFFNPSPVGDFKTEVLDQVVLTAVPEASAASMLIVGLVGLVGFFRLQRQRVVG